MAVPRGFETGRVSTLLLAPQPPSVALDVSSRLLTTARDGTPLEELVYDRASDETKAAIDAYTNGVNAFLDRVRAGDEDVKLSEEFEFALINSQEIPDWTPQDSVAVGMLFLSNFVNRANVERRAGERLMQMSADMHADFYTGWHIDPDSTIVEASGETYDALGSLSAAKGLPFTLAPERRDALYARASSALLDAGKSLSALDRWQGDGFFGSNNWATAPELNTGDFAILANDPHIGFSNPSVWELIEMDAKSAGTGDFHAAGASFPGLPGVLIGYTEDVAWSATVAVWDLSDVYIEELTEDGTGVVFNGEPVPFTRRTFEFRGVTGPEMREFLYVPHHGPVLAIDEEMGIAVSFKSILQDSATDLEMFVGLGSSSSMEDARSRLALSQGSGFSFTLIDGDGNIAYYPFATIPRREWDTTAAPAWMPLPGDGNFEWGETPIGADELPQMFNPPSNFIATANAGITDDMVDGIPGNAGYPPLQTPFIAPSPRQARIVDMIEEAAGQIDVATHQAIQLDDTVWLAQQTLPEILQILEGQERIGLDEIVLQQLRDWDYTCPTGIMGNDPMGMKVMDEAVAKASIGCTAFHVLYVVATTAVFGDELDEIADDAGVEASGEVGAFYWLLLDSSQLRMGDAYWDDVSTADTEDAATTLSKALTATAAQLEKFFGTDPDDWRWGRIHTLTLRADLLSDFGISDFGNGPVAAPGGLLTVNVANPSSPGRGEGSYEFRSGASMRMIVEGRADGMVGRFQLPGGSVHRRDSPFYENLFLDWLGTSYFTMPFTVEEVDASASEVTTFVGE